MSYTVRPLSDRTWLRPESKRKATRFSSSWPETEALLVEEVGRYGAAETGQQYTGFKALPGGTPLPAPRPRMTSERAGEVIRGYGGSFPTLRESYRAALRKTHPDHGGQREDFDRLQEAARVLGLAR